MVPDSILVCAFTLSKHRTTHSGHYASANRTKKGLRCFEWVTSDGLRRSKALLGKTLIVKGLHQPGRTVLSSKPHNDGLPMGIRRGHSRGAEQPNPRRRASPGARNAAWPASATASKASSSKIKSSPLALCLP